MSGTSVGWGDVARDGRDEDGANASLLTLTDITLEWGTPLSNVLEPDFKMKKTPPSRSQYPLQSSSLLHAAWASASLSYQFLGYSALVTRPS
eukprot:CAMPEP_0198490318 /NCGR_PEP_ID=MMETSP1462-20131121/2045_1 /TAXON_ID=1333877 /ORGANISM="Brandtodinium nutriculum, Strain RCC3387" /LENGTH=91 /DNA_ID=CAMNT_0044218867 /DNA_START=119 /DNA_END=391 /DNA_ORIENTATION=+